MSRVRKLLIAGLVLAVGMGLAWPYRKTGPSASQVEPRSDHFPAAFDSLASATPLPESAQRHTAAKLASTGEPTSTTNRFDLANHPSLAKPPLSQSADSLRSGPTAATDFASQGRPGPTEHLKPTSRPAYATTEDAQALGSEAAGLEEILHIVRNTDTLEKLAKRYLGDAGRALEIFDLNRDQLSNPYLLPIGAKLKIPVQPKQGLD